MEKMYYGDCYAQKKRSSDERNLLCSRHEHASLDLVWISAVSSLYPEGGAGEERRWIMMQLEFER